MAVKFFDSTGDTTSTTGTGSLVGAATPPARYRSPASAGVTTGDATVIRIESADGTQWEVCETVISTAGPSLVYSRGEIQASSTGARVDFTSGVKNIYYVIGKKYMYNLPVVVGDVPAGAINGSNATFATTYNFIPGTVEVRLNGITLKLTDDYTTSGTQTINMVSSPVTGDKITTNYIKA